MTFGAITTIINVLGVGREILTTVSKLVKEVEKEDVDDGVSYGKEKKELVMTLTLSVYDLADEALELPISKKKVKEVVDVATEAFVKFFNAIGKFRSLSK